MEIINDKSHHEHEEYKTWATSLNYEEFDIEKTNDRIERKSKSSYMYDYI